ADLLKISNTAVAVSKVQHKAFIEVDEEGTEAAAATTVVLTKSLPVAMKPEMFFAQHAFAFALISNEAKFDGISKSPTRVEKIIHKAFIKTNEEGSEAASASGIMTVVRMAVFKKYEDFTVNHPALFVIRQNQSNIMLFFGTLNDIARKNHHTGHHTGHHAGDIPLYKSRPIY
uniref:Serpin domain-containing protein n=1 Tax=Strigamia maritima TaxID=126957 RepID=T1ISI4_STRMM